MLDQWFDYFAQNPLIAALSGVAALIFVMLVVSLSRPARRPEAERPMPPVRRKAAPPDMPESLDKAAPETAAPELEEARPEPRIARSERQRAPSAPMPMPTPVPGAPVGAEQEDHFVVTVHFGTDRHDAGLAAPVDARFTDDRARRGRGASPMTYGTCEVSIPKIHKVGELEAPSWYQSAQPGKHVLLLSARTADRASFLANLEKAMADEKQAFVFVHGFSVSFADAARRTAQMAFDMKFRGVPAFFSWPTEVLSLTNPDPTAYSEAENNARWATEHFRTFLLDVVRNTGAETVHLIAHSMGNRVVTDALMELFWVLTPQEKKVIGEVILTAPDIDADVFIDQIAPRITAMESRITLYASTKDSALAQSKRVHGYRRAGDFAALSILPDKVEVVDASEVDTDSFGHSYYGNAHSVISDICHLMAGRVPAAQRTVTLSALAASDGNPFWRVRQDSTLEQVWAELASPKKTKVV